MSEHVFEIPTGGVVPLLAEPSPAVERLARHIFDEWHVRVVPLQEPVGAKALERFPGAKLILASPDMLARLLRSSKVPILRWRHLVLLVDREHLLEAADYADWADGFLFLEIGCNVSLALELACEGIVVVPPYITSTFSLNETRLEHVHELRPVELHVLLCLGKGMTNRAIGDELDLSQPTVKSVVRNLLTKMHFRNRIMAGVFSKLMQDELARTTSGSIQQAPGFDQDNEPEQNHRDQKTKQSIKNE